MPLAALEAVGDPLGKVARVLMEICSYAGEQWVVFAEYPTPPTPHPPTQCGGVVTACGALSCAGTGDVLRVQALLHTCSEHFEDKEPKGQEEPSSTGGEEKDKKEQPPKPEPGSLAEVGSHQAFAVLGLALIAMGEGIGSEMALRTFNHLVGFAHTGYACSPCCAVGASSTLTPHTSPSLQLQYGEPVIRRSVPLALCLVSVSHPDLSIMDTLSKFSHDSDPEVAYSAILAMGIIGAGTNNARLGGLLRQLAQFYCKDPSALYIVRLAQVRSMSLWGLLHMVLLYYGPASSLCRG